ncbi:GDH/6PGL endoplasmic bifunctional protein-like [Mizuhopecten yessoensis]|uniref:GDH/6PGL endoplasmic bifunctional protein n=1 Tax=Mizuhopecten yessoensis TaxID=6573 RepID=A0A210QWL8_MIZYE|nr:GDH/6PGL endoplasmic bifunctional protein-like [Mizuhopecten yessoensis]XP_021347866.1 GDH/6PGL endoplasmic bifunctional protein-like [Mizuhopecten yessoensis]OWF53086.1 GDH/6PGL endoplasmic bifunctional protein [Mizuhopecten yessoensis]
MECWAALCVILGCIGMHLVLCSGDKKTHTDFVLIGAGGDLAKKYLWQSMFQLFINHANDNTTFNFYGCGRSNYEEGRDLIDNILQKHISCEFMSYSDLCEKKKVSFSKIVRYFPLKTDLDFQNFGLHLEMGDSNEAVEVGRIMYMAIPPSAYASMAAKMWECCYGKAPMMWNRLVLEKPFGSDYQSAVKMAEEIAKYYKEEEIYRVDHYLGKSVVKQILPFRHANRDILEPLLTSDHVSRVEVVMKETIGVQGRIDFYDQYGIVRDVMQNHLTELLALVAMELPDEITNTEQVDKSRLRVLSQIKSVNKNSVLIGQYADYVMQAQSEKENVTMSKFTPTFGAARVEVRNRRWSGVPFILVSGKHLDERSSFIRVVFKENDFCISGCRHHNGSHWKGQKQIIFQIGHGNLPSAGIMVSKDLLNPALPSSLKDLPVTADDIAMYGQSLNDLTFLVPKDNQPAYVTVVDDMFLGRRESFVAKERLLSLWRLWSPVLNDLQGIAPRLYQREEDRSLNFKLTSNGLQYMFTDKFNAILESTYGQQFSSLPASYLDQQLVIKPTEDILIHAAAEYILNAINERLKVKDDINIAFSGGNSPTKLFQILVDKYQQIPWEFIHIWQVDERCVSRQLDGSNFKLLHDHLIRNIRVPYMNVHPMTVEVADRVCSPGDRGNAIYEEEIRHHIPDLQFDLILLGVGSDGHTASLFPGKSHEGSSLVAMDTVKARMTLTLPLLNKGKQILVLVTGSKKHDILMTLPDDKKTATDYPILGVKPVVGNVTWFVDYDAWFGTR